MTLHTELRHRKSKQRISGLFECPGKATTGDDLAEPNLTAYSGRPGFPPAVSSRCRCRKAWVRSRYSGKPRHAGRLRAHRARQQRHSAGSSSAAYRNRRNARRRDQRPDGAGLEDSRGQHGRRNAGRDQTLAIAGLIQSRATRETRNAVAQRDPLRRRLVSQRNGPGRRDRAVDHGDARTRQSP